MFEKIYKRKFDVDRHENGPLGAERRAFLQKFSDEENPSQNRLVIVACYLLLVTEILRLAERGDEKIGLKEIQEQAGVWSTRKSKRLRPLRQCCPIDNVSNLEVVRSIGQPFV
ncbi:MAG: hypothetical protein KDB27_12225 [Planctomycetales bacterium]|nr:hypothetical protein [Planctomycetales bacterium]